MRQSVSHEQVAGASISHEQVAGASVSHEQVAGAPGWRFVDYSYRPGVRTCTSRDSCRQPARTSVQSCLLLAGSETQAEQLKGIAACQQDDVTRRNWHGESVGVHVTDSHRRQSLAASAKKCPKERVLSKQHPGIGHA